MTHHLGSSLRRRCYRCTGKRERRDRAWVANMCVNDGCCVCVPVCVRACVPVCSSVARTSSEVTRNQLPVHRDARSGKRRGSKSVAEYLHSAPRTTCAPLTHIQMKEGPCRTQQYCVTHRTKTITLTHGNMLDSAIAAACWIPSLPG